MKFKLHETVFVKHTDTTLSAGNQKFAKVVGFLKTRTGEQAYLLEFDEFVGGHDCGGKTKPGRGWALPEHCLAHEGEDIGYEGIARTTYSTCGKTAPLTLDSMKEAIDAIQRDVEKASGVPGFNTITYRGVPVVVSGFDKRFTISREPNYASILRSNNKKGGDMLKRLSTQIRRIVKGDEDLKALLEIGVLDSELDVENHALAIDMLVTIFKKELAEEARTRLQEIKEQQEK